MKQSISSIRHSAKGLLYSSLGCALLAMVLIASCNETKHHTTEVNIIWDVTELHTPVPSAEEVLPLFALSNDAANGAILRFAFASDVSFNHETVFILRAAGNVLTTNPFDRKREIETFEKSIRAFLDSLAMDTIGRSHSSLYVPIAKSLNRLATESIADRKILLVYSDLRENSAVMNFYTPQTLTLLHNDSAQAERMLSAQQTLGDLSGIEIHLLYQPRDAADDAAYRIISGFYTSLFERKGAHVYVSANVTVQ
jgi:hypothetical protein